jgi:hypothetical protein
MSVGWTNQYENTNQNITNNSPLSTDPDKPEVPVSILVWQYQMFLLSYLYPLQSKMAVLLEWDTPQ